MRAATMLAGFLGMLHSAVAMEAHALSRTQRATAACTSYVVGTVLTTPLDVLKTRAQATGSVAGRNLLREIAAQGGALAWFRGLGPSLLMAPGMVIQYTLVDELRRHMPVVPAACIAGAVDITMKTPFERVKTRVQAAMESGGGEGGVLGQMARETRANGLASLWGGYGATLARDLPYVAIYWCTYDSMRGLLRADAADRSPSRRVALSFISGMVAGTVAATLVTPADVIKTQIQVRPNASVWTVLSGLAARGSVGAFFVGLSARLIRTPLYAGITLSSFETLKMKMIQRNTDKRA